MTVKGKLEDWHLLNKLALRTELATGTATVVGKEISFRVSLNIDNKAIFVEFPEGIKVTYHTDDMVTDAIREYKVFLATATFVKEQELKKKTQEKPKP